MKDLSKGGITISKLGKIEVVNPREIWSNEERNFTPWLEENIEELSEVIGIPLVIEEIEKRVGNYELDMYGKVEGTNEIVVIENQLEVSDHKHLGQLITYASGLNASIIIWVTPRINDEHKKAIEWLNEISQDEKSFFLVRPEVLRIENSLPAVRFHVESSPSDFERTIRGLVGQNERKSHQIKRMFWSEFIEYCKDHDLRWGAGRRTTKDNWMNFSIGKSGISTTASMANKSRLKAEIAIDLPDKEDNKKLFDRAFARKEEIEKRFGLELSWERLPNRKVSRIAVYLDYDKNELEESEDYRRELFTWLEKNIEMMRTICKGYVIDKSII